MIPVVVDVHDLGQLIVVQHGPGQQDLPARRRTRVQQVLLGTHHPSHGGHDFFADRVQRRIGDLREQFHEVVVEQTRTL